MPFVSFAFLGSKIYHSCNKRSLQIYLFRELRVKRVFAIILLFSLCGASMAQDQPQEETSNNDVFESSKSDFMIVVAGGLAGAILGLSTLSFYDEPKEHTNNILMGASLGLIAGVVVVAMGQATQSQNMNYSGHHPNFYKNRGFDTYARINSLSDMRQNYKVEEFTPLNVNFNFSF